MHQTHTSTKTTLQPLVERYGLKRHLQVPAELQAKAPRQLERIINAIETPMLRHFLAMVLAEPEVSQILGQPKIGEDNKVAAQQSQSLQTLIARLCHGCRFTSEQRDVIYIAAILNSIEDQLQTYIVSGSTVRDALFTIVRPHLYELERVSLQAGEILRLCMGWSNEDGDTGFSHWIRAQLTEANAQKNIAANSSGGGHGNQ